jgi:hypothetical protein
MAMAYYFDHRDEIDREIAAEVEVDQQIRSQAPPSPFLKRLRAEGRL